MLDLALPGPVTQPLCFPISKVGTEWPVPGEVTGLRSANLGSLWPGREPSSNPLSRCPGKLTQHAGSVSLSAWFSKASLVGFSGGFRKHVNSVPA